MTESSTTTLGVIENRESVAAVLPPIRRQILKHLGEKPDSAVGLARELGIPRQKMNYHFRCLEKAGLLELDSEQQRRGCTERRFHPAAQAYLIRPDLLEALGNDPQEVRDRFSSAYLIRMAARTMRDVARMREESEKAEKRLPTLAIEVDVDFASPAERASFAEELTEMVAELASRYHKPSPQSRSHRFALAGYPTPKQTETQEDKIQ